MPDLKKITRYCSPVICFFAKVLNILCDQEGAAVSSGLSAYFGDSEATVSDAVTDEHAAAATAGHDGGHEGRLLSDVLTPPEVS